MSNTPEFRSWSYDPQRFTVAAPWVQEHTAANSLGLLLQEWVGPQNATPGFYENAPSQGTEGIAGIRKVGVGDYVIKLQDTYSRIKRLALTLTDPSEVTPVATTILCADGTIAGGFPNQTDLTQEVVASSANGDGGTAVAHAQPTQTASAAVFTAHALIGATLKDSAGNSFLITENSTTVLTVAGTVEPASSGTSNVIVNGAILQTFTANAHTAFSAATFTDSSAVWNRNVFQNQLLIDSTGTTFLIASNTETALTLQFVTDTVVGGNKVVAANPTTGQYQIINNFPVGTDVVQCFGVASSSGANTFTPTFVSSDAMFAGQFAGMILRDSVGNRYLIEDNSTTVMDVQSITNPTSPGTTTTPATGAWQVLAPAAAASVEVLLGSGLGTAVQSAVTLTNTASLSQASSSGVVAAPSAALVKTLTGFTGTSTGGVTTISAGGAVIAAHALAGGTVTDGTTESRIIDNSALTASTGTITTVTTLAATITATGNAWASPVPPVTVTNGAVTMTAAEFASAEAIAAAQTFSGSFGVPADPAAAESGVIEIEMSR